MLKKDTLIANEALKGLTEEQIKAIETLSANDENQVIGTKFGEVYRQMDATIESATGIKRNGDEKTYLYLERAAKEFAGKFGDYDSLKTKIADLEAKLEKGGDEAIKAQLESTKKELATAKEQFNTLKTSFDTEKANHEKALNDIMIDNEINKAKEGIQFKAGFSEYGLNSLIGQAIKNVKSKHPEFEERDGGKILIFHNDDKTPLLNAENKLNPFTAKELLLKEFETMGILATKAKGAGGQGGDPQPILGATTQVEAEDYIAKALAAKGISKTSLLYQAERDKMWKENNFDTLPLTK